MVETDGLVDHRTPAQQALDRRRDQALTAAGFIALRFTNAQVRLEPELVIDARGYDSKARNDCSSMISVPSFSAFASFEPGSLPATT